MALPLILAGVGAGLGYLQAKEKQRQERENMLANAEQIRYSPWTGLKSNIQGASGNSPLLAAGGGALGGGLQGVQIAQGMQGGQSQALGDLSLQKQFKEVHGRMPTAEELSSLRPQKSSWGF